MLRVAQLQQKMLQPIGDYAELPQQQLQQSSVNSAARSATHHDGPPYHDQLKSVSAKIASVKATGLAQEPDDYLGVQGMRLHHDNRE